LEVTTATATTAPVVSIDSYTSADGTTAVTAGGLTFPASATNQHAFIQLPLHAQRRGVRSVESVNVAVAGSAGVANVVILRPLLRLGLDLANAGVTWQQPRKWSLLDEFMTLPRVFDNAVLALAGVTSTSAGIITVSGRIECVYG